MRADRHRCCGRWKRMQQSRAWPVIFPWKNGWHAESVHVWHVCAIPKTGPFAYGSADVTVVLLNFFSIDIEWFYDFTACNVQRYGLQRAKIMLSTDFRKKCDRKSVEKACLACAVFTSSYSFWWRTSLLPYPEWCLQASPSARGADCSLTEFVPFLSSEFF